MRRRDKLVGGEIEEKRSGKRRRRGVKIGGGASGRKTERHKSSVAERYSL